MGRAATPVRRRDVVLARLTGAAPLYEEDGASWARHRATNDIISEALISFPEETDILAACAGRMAGAPDLFSLTAIQEQAAACGVPSRLSWFLTALQHVLQGSRHSEPDIARRRRHARLETLCWHFLRTLPTGPDDRAPLAVGALTHGAFHQAEEAASAIRPLS